MSAAVELVTDYGWRRTTVEQIAERAGVAKGTFFVHFKTKEAIAPALVELQVGAAGAARDAVVARGGSAVERLEAATLALGAHAAAHVELSRAALIASLESREVGSTSDALFSRLHRGMVDDATEALAQGLLQGSDAETIASLLMACYLGAALQSAATPAARPIPDVLRALVAATLGALAPPGRTAKKAPAKPKATSPKR